MIIALHLVLCHITWLSDKYETCRIFAPLHEGSMSGDVMMTSMQPRTPAPITAWQALLFKQPNIHCQGLNVKKNMIKVCPRFIDKIKKDGPHTKTCLLWVVLERAQTAGGPTVSSPSLENTFAYFSVFIFSTYQRGKYICVLFSIYIQYLSAWKIHLRTYQYLYSVLISVENTFAYLRLSKHNVSTFKPVPV